MTTAEVTPTPAPAAAAPDTTGHRSPTQLAVRRFLRNRLAVAGALVLVVVVLAALFAPLIAGHPPNQVDLDAIRQAPSATHWLGTDASGRDVLARMLYAGRISLLVGVAGALLSVVLGTLLGAVAGLAPSFVDSAIMRTADVVLSFPAIVVILVLAGVLGPSVTVLIVAIALTHWPQACRVVHGVTLSLREQDYLHAARAGGARSWWLIRRHVVPAALPPVIVSATLAVAQTILLEATLSFLGLGVQPPQASWGNMLNDAQSLTVIQAMPWPARRRRPAAVEGGPLMVESLPEPLLQIEDLCVDFASEDGVVRAVDAVSYTVRPGEVLGVVGESGSGKSVTAMSVLGLIRPPGRISGGTVRFRGRDLRALSDKEMRTIRGGKIAMIFQDPMTSLNPVATVGAQIVEAIRLHRRDVGRAEAHARAVQLLASVGVPDPERRARQYPHEFSGGMRQRAVIAMAVANAPDLLIADEPTTALDVTIQAQVLDLLRSAQRAADAATVLITHDLGVVAELADRVVVMYAGRVVEEADVHTLFHGSRHPYTLGLLAGVPRPGEGGKRLWPIPGSPPDMRTPPTGCAFHPRCPLAREVCRTERPVLSEVGAGHRTACHAQEELAKVDGRALFSPATAASGQHTTGHGAPVAEEVR